jgi:hypothetical protein
MSIIRINCKRHRSIEQINERLLLASKNYLGIFFLKLRRANNDRRRIFAIQA